MEMAPFLNGLLLILTRKTNTRDSVSPLVLDQGRAGLSSSPRASAIPQARLRTMKVQIPARRQVIVHEGVRLGPLAVLCGVLVAAFPLFLTIRRTLSLCASVRFRRGFYVLPQGGLPLLSWMILLIF